MSFSGGPTPYVNTFKGANLNSLRYNTSQAGSVIPIVYGTQRLTINVIEGFGFHGSGGGAKGGKGLGGSGGKKGSNQNYTVNVAFALCQGPISYSDGSGQLRVWANGGVRTGAAATGLNVYTGADGQAPDPIFLSSSPYVPVQGYSGTAYVTGTPLQLGSTPALPNIQIEVSGFLAGTAGPAFTQDARPDLIIIDLLTSHRYGAEFPSANIDSTSLADFGNFCQAAELAMSIVLDRQQPADRWSDDLVRLASSAAFWSGSTLKIVPYADQSFSANGASWSPNLTPRYSLTDDDFIPFGTQSDPVLVTRTDTGELPNWSSLEYMDRANSYNNQTVIDFDQSFIDRYGLRSESAQQGHAFSRPEPAFISLHMTLLRRLYVRRTFKFKLGWKFSRLEPMDIVAITDPSFEGAIIPVRITSVEENDNNELSFDSEEIPLSPIVAHTVQAPLGEAVFNMFVEPGDANTPVIYEPPPDLTGGSLVIWLVTSGGNDWGGAQVWISTDDSTYALAGTVFKGARQGLLTSILPATADPDVTDTFSVDLTMSGGQLISGTATDADNLVTLSYCDGELISYQTATLTSAFNYNIGTRIRRGAYGTTIASHPIGSQFARIGPNDSSTFKYEYPSSFVGQTIYIKLVSFNSFGLKLQDISTLSPHLYVIGGGGAAAPVFEIPGSFSGIPSTNLVVGRFAFCSTVILPNNFSGSRAAAGTAATGTTTFVVAKNNVTIGTMSFAPSASVATFTSTAVSTAFNAGDELTIHAPASPDATLANVAWTILGRQGMVTPVAEVHGSTSGIPSANLIVQRWLAENPITFPAGAVGSVGYAETTATASTVYSIRKNGVQFATMTFGIGLTEATFFGAATVLNPGDELTVVAPASPDATLANIAWAIKAANNLTIPVPFVSGSVSGHLSANVVVQRRVFAASFVIPAGMPNSAALADTAGAVVDTTFDIRKNGVSVGNMTFAVGSGTATFVMPFATAFNSGDVLTVVTPASPDAALLGLAWIFAGTI